MSNQPAFVSFSINTINMAATCTCMLLNYIPKQLDMCVTLDTTKQHKEHVLLVLCAEPACARVLIECPTKQHTLHVLLVLCAETTHAHQHTCRFSTGYSLCCFDSRARNTHVRIIRHIPGSTCVQRVEFRDIRLTRVRVWFQHVLYCSELDWS